MTGDLAGKQLVHLPEDWARALPIRRADHAAGRAHAAAFEAAAAYVGTRYGACLCSFLAGSYAVGDAGEGSDVDLFVIDDRFASPGREQVLHDAYPLQIGVMSLAYALGLVERAKLRGTLSFVPAFAIARKLTGRDDVFKVVRSAARAAMADGPRPPTAERVARARSAVINNFLKVARAPPDCAERYGACTKLVHSSAVYLQLSAGAWVLNEVRYEPVLRDSAEYKALVAAVPAALSGDLADLLAAAQALLQARGEFLWDTSAHGLLPWANQGG